ncbi:FAD-dependent oxidoreductase [Ammoniphilus resinae]|uniref:FAD-dependent oxidoreductase n=1 Tax=Ammoniphilus resinae TaxID=861532 RepID=A0ABS4GTA2_9BACL|nr:FAD-dependent oxidoreductase [Ammoniphilus resinae]MBP1933262.1 hypothetical protein [Ammoniphilus resinae]
MLEWTTDVAVLGGGPAGIAAAISAKQEGADVILIEKYGFLGGMATAGMLGSICGFYGKNDKGKFSVVGGIGSKLLDRLSSLNGLGQDIHILGKTYVIPYDIQAFKFVCDDWVEETGIQLILHAWAVDVDSQNGEVREVHVQTKEGLGILRAKVFIDATGDGDIAAAAGAEYTLDPHQLQLPSTLFTVANVNQEKAEKVDSAQWASLVQLAKSKGYRLPRVSGTVRNLPYKGLFRLNVTMISNALGVLNGVNHQDLTFAEIEGRKQVREYFKFMKEYVPGFEDSFIAEVAPQVGIRETRKILGEYVLTEEDIFRNIQPHDVIALNAWPLEQHTGEPVTKWEFIPGSGHHGIPFRCLQPVNINNVMVVGRCISATHQAQSSVRVMGPAMAMGEAGGVAAALMVKKHLNNSRDIELTDLQETLVHRGAILSLDKTDWQ